MLGGGGGAFNIRAVFHVCQAAELLGLEAARDGCEPPTPPPPLLQWSDYIQHEFLKERREGEEVRILGEAIRRDGGDSREDRFKPMFGNFKAHACKFPPANFNKSQINA